MQQTIEALLVRDSSILESYEQAVQHWREILAGVDIIDADALAESLFTEQMWFEKNCGGRHVGQEVMVITGIAQFYSTQAGFADNEQKAKAVLAAFARSSCSREVKRLAPRVAAFYGLEEQKPRP